MHRIEKSIEVGMPIRTVYNQWTQFEEFPRFMEGVEQVRQLDDKRLHWKANLYGKTQEWDAVIEEQQPDQRITWHSTTGPDNAGKVSFISLAPNRTRISLEMSYTPEGAVENIGTWMGMVDRRIEGDLKRFQDFIEKRGAETGAWRGEIENQKVTNK